jgi:hypothetical protein
MDEAGGWSRPNLGQRLMAAVDQQINSFSKSHVWRCKLFLLIVIFEVGRIMFLKGLSDEIEMG